VQEVGQPGIEGQVVCHEQGRSGTPRGVWRSSAQPVVPMLEDEGKILVGVLMVQLQQYMHPQVQQQQRQVRMSASGKTRLLRNQKLKFSKPDKSCMVEVTGTCQHTCSLRS
jgi:hypothetical protein